MIGILFDDFMFKVAVDSKLGKQDSERRKNVQIWSLHTDHMGDDTRQDTMLMHSQNRNRFKAMFSGIW